MSVSMNPRRPYNTRRVVDEATTGGMSLFGGRLNQVGRDQSSGMITQRMAGVAITQRPAVRNLAIRLQQRTNDYEVGLLLCFSGEHSIEINALFRSSLLGY
jgi:hypothetical protein